MAPPSPKRRTFTYKKVNTLEIPLDFYPPDSAHNVPILLWFHGGGLLQRKRSSVSPHMRRAVHAHHLALVSADYRLAPQVGIAEIYEDVRDCIAFIRNKLPQLAGEGVLDASRLAVSGSSAGGYLAFLAGLYVEPKPTVILPIYPITDPLGLFFTTPQPHPFGGKPADVKALERFIDVDSEVVANNEEDSARSGMYMYMLQEANLGSLLEVKAGDDNWRVAKKVYECGLPPAYVVHGDADTAVGVDQADEVVGVMVGCGTEVVYERLRGVNHLFDKEESVGMEKMYEWMMKHL
ncbi:hypothetical protein LTR35_013963 [Friedmanniomyces endolithicus]|uniref:Alpha/beta hydrolase fold-3 domain-containing protein n=1 Tax=Friedmanniomyces endolithicus TaxID=329885 RepID=A0AAN6J0Y0_9PEZI|nr:hypothetical protein LTR35_013963 [Friedmanniomyces endolithicus]KAK0281048.1 hypothetical protein LTS00_012689 [Friedmanniomyces endolithicus]KAK0307422.1 hypothetical protein LTR82_015930 [Friedmanniomyces endolithicus]KAK0987263.1 hypothetical protein LTR54_013216 [Friedmanniomyces endolithicus]